LPDELLNGFDWPASLVSVSEMRPFGVVVDQPGVEIGLQRLDLTGTPVTDLRPLDGLSALQTLILPSGRLR
jgi:hypothetical protein